MTFKWTILVSDACRNDVISFWPIDHVHSKVLLWDGWHKNPYLTVDKKAFYCRVLIPEHLFRIGKMERLFFKSELFNAAEELLFSGKNRGTVEFPGYGKYIVEWITEPV